MLPQTATDPSKEGPAHWLRIARGSLYLDRELCDLYFSGIESVAALSRADQTFLLPLRAASAGGMLLKLRNARGDRVVYAPEFLQGLGIDVDAAERCVTVRWSTELMGLLLEGIRSAEPGKPRSP